MAVELVGGAFLGAAVGAMLNELILFVKRAYRCKEDCKTLKATLESVAPLLMDVVNSSDLKNPSYQAWLQDLHTLLEQANGIVDDCVVKRSRISFKYVRRRYLSSRIQNINGLIRGKLSSEGILVTLNVVQEINRKVDCLSVASSVIDQRACFERQDVPSHVVAFDNDPFKKLKELILSTPSSASTKTIGIRGKGGAGKTLLAKMVNNDEDVKKKFGADLILWITVGQDVMVSSIYKRMGQFLNDGGVFEKDIIGRDLEAQRMYLMEAFKQKQALVIFDDIWGNCEKKRAMIYWLDICKGNGSTILITTRDNKVLDRARATERIEVESLSVDESWNLFSFHAFQPSIPPLREVKDIAMEICKECKGLPLALEVIGGALWDTKDERGWKYALSRLKKSESLTSSTTMEDELFDRLKFSYDALSVDAKKCFLYFAAFPEDYRVPTKELCSIWQAEDMFGACDVEDTSNSGRMNLITLADRSLIDLDDYGEYAKVHDVMRDLAMRIIRDAMPGEWAYECQFEPGKMLERLPEIKETTRRVSLIGTCVAKLDSQLCKTGHNLRICLLSSLKREHGNKISTLFPGEFFSNMKSVSYLNLHGCELLKELPESIKELKSLTHLDLSKCDFLKDLSESIKELKSLTHLDLSWCDSLKELPESIKELKSLTHLYLSCCSSLKELPESIKELKSLMHLNLSECDSLKELPESIKELKSLTHLDLSWCRSLKELLESMKELKSLTHLDLSGCRSLKELPESIKELKSLMHLYLSCCSSLKELPQSMKELKSLTHLNLSECTSLKELPESIKELKSLTHLYLNSCTSLKELPESIKELKSLMHLYLGRCSSLKELPESIKELKFLTHFYLSDCDSLKELPESIKELKSLTHLYLSCCSSLKELPESIKELKSLTHLDLSECDSLKELPESIKELKSLTHLDLSSCKSLKELPEIMKELKSLTHLDLSKCDFLKELPESIKELKSLTHLDLSECTFLKELPESIKELKSLTHLYLSSCKSLKELPEIMKELKSLTHLDLSNCDFLKELPESIKELKSLTHLDLSDCDSLKELPESIKELKSLMM